MNVLIVVPVYDEAPLIASTTTIRRFSWPSAARFSNFREATRTFADAEWILVTDADAHLEADALERLLEVAAADPEAGVVGARVRPAAAHPLETLHWRFTDWLREREHDRGCRSRGLQGHARGMPRRSRPYHGGGASFAANVARAAAPQVPQGGCVPPRDRALCAVRAADAVADADHLPLARGVVDARAPGRNAVRCVGDRARWRTQCPQPSRTM